MGVNRRRFIMLVAGGVAGTLATPIPWKLADDAAIWTQNWPWIPRLKYGALDAKAAISKLGPATPAMVKTAAGRPFIALGNPDNPLSQGSVTALSVNEVQMLYSPARVKGPMKKVGDGKFEPISWDDAEAMLVEKLSAARGKTAMVSGDDTGTANEVLSGLLAGLGSTDYYLMPCEHQLAAAAWHGAMGGTGHPGYDIDNADFVLILGPDLFDSWGTPLRNGKAFSRTHPIDGEASATYVYAGPVLNRTASVCEEYVAVAPGGETALALGIAAELIRMGASASVGGFDDFSSLVSGSYSPAKAAKAAGVDPKVITDLAAKLSKAKRPLVIPGSVISQGGSPAGFIAGMSLNILLGNLGKPGGVRPIAEVDPVVPGARTRPQMMQADFVDYLMQVDVGKKPAPAVLMVYEADPAYALPEAGNMAGVLAKIPFKVSFSSFMDETAKQCDLIMPNPLSIERFEDMITPYGSGYGSYAMTPPVIAPVADAKQTPDVFLRIAKKLGVDLSFSSFKAVLEAKIDEIAGHGGYMATEKDPWVAVLDGYGPALGDMMKGLISGGSWVNPAVVDEWSLSLAPDLLQKAAGAGGGAGDYPLFLAPQYDLNIGSTKVATPPLNLPTIRAEELDGMWLVASLSSATAQQAGVAEGDMVTVSSPRGELKAKVAIDETVMDGAVAVPMGLGRTAWDQFTNGKGANVNEILTVSAEPGTNKPVWIGSKVKIAKS